MKPLQESYPIVLYQDVNWADMDAYEHVNNTVYFRYFQDARIEFFNRYGISDYKAKHNIGPILAATNCNYKLPLTYPDHIHIGARFEILSPKKIDMEYVIYSKNFSAIAAEGNALLVYYDYSKGASCEIPDQILQTMKR